MFESAFGIDIGSKLFWVSVGLLLSGLIGVILRAIMGGGTTSTTTEIANRMVKVEEPTSIVADDLEAIEGVGPKIAAVFHKNNIYRFAQVAGMEVREIQALLDDAGERFDLARPFSWPLQAKLLDNRRFGAFAAITSVLRGGVVSPQALAGIGEATAARLAAINVASVEVLARHDATELSNKLSATGDAVNPDRAGGWVLTARKVLDGDVDSLLGLFGVDKSALTVWSGKTVTSRTAIAERRLAETITVSVPTAKTGFWSSFWWPLLLGLLGLILASLLSGTKAPKVEVAEPVAVTPTGSGIISELRDGKPMLIVYFETAKSDVANELSTESAKLKDYLDANPEARLSVSGYVDPRGDAAFNATLSKNRAEKVAAALAAAGIAGDRIDLDKPADIVGNEGSMAGDRKVEVKIKESGVVEDGAAVEATATN
jgi:flagellar motor protein MotB